MRRTAWLFGLMCCLAAPPASAADYPAPLLAVNFAGDLVNPPELGILDREIARVPKGRAVVLPFSEETRGHGSHTIAGLWKHLLARLLAASGRRP